MLGGGGVAIKDVRFVEGPTIGLPPERGSDDWLKCRIAQLRRGGDLRDSVQNYSAGLEAVVGTNLVYGAVHQFGSAEGSDQNIPARPYLGLSDEDRADIGDLVEGEIAEMLQ